MIPGRTIVQNKQIYLYFSGTSYLGMIANKQFSQYITEGLQLYGNNFGGSRLSGIHEALYAQFETTLAQLVGTPQALCVSSGTLAGQLVASYFAQYKIPTFWTPDAHPSLKTIQQVTPLSINNWKAELLDFAQQSPFVLYSNSIDPLYCKDTDFSWLDDLPTHHQYTIIVDDSHGIGVVNQGRGIWPKLQQYPHIKILVVGSLGKAFAIPAGFITGDEKTIDNIRRYQLFGGASPLLPAYAHAFIKGQSLYQAAHSQLQQNIQQFDEAVGDNFQKLPNYPVFYTTQNDLAHHLKTHNILISSFAYPTPQDLIITRVVLNSLHTSADINQLNQVVKTYF